MAATATSTTATASSDPLYCPACTEPFDATTNPAGFAPCFHPLCQRCIDKAATSVGAKPRECLWLVQGVYCRTPFTAAQLVSGKAAMAAPMCGSCEEAPATHHCNDCNLDLCATEAAMHQKIKTTKTHTIASLGIVATGQPMCTVHITCTATQFCDKCDLPACVDCLSGTHAGHPFIALTAGLARRAQQIQDAVSTLLVPKKEQCLSAIAAVREQIERLEKHKAATQQQIRETFDPLILSLETTVAALKLRKGQLHEHVTKAINADIKSLAAQCDEIVVITDHLTRVEETQQEILVGLADETKRTALASRVKTLSKIEIPADPVITTTSAFVMTDTATPTSVLTIDISSLGQIQTAPLRKLLMQNRPSHPKLNYTTLSMPARTIGGVGSDQGLFRFPWGLCLDCEDNLIVGDSSNNRIQIITQQGQHVRSIQAKNFVGGVATDPNGSIWATVGRSELNLFNPLTSVVKRTINCPGALGLCCLDDGALIVGCEERNKVVCFDPDGTTRWSSTGRGFRYAAGVAIIPNLQLVAVCDKNNNRIQLLSLQDGHFVQFISGTIFPYGIMFDPVAQTLIVGEKNSISAWALDTAPGTTLDGKLIHRWAQNSTHVVTGAAIAPDGTLYACDSYNHRIIVF